MKNLDTTLIHLLELDGERLLIDEILGLWVKFDIYKVIPTQERPHGIRYSLSLHDRSNNRIMGFDNAHIIEYGGKRFVAPKQQYDHWHRDKSDEGRPYHYQNASKLLEDFWNEVNKKVEQMKDKTYA
jgi:Family of unknown function (DUF6516)